MKIVAGKLAVYSKKSLKENKDAPETPKIGRPRKEVKPLLLKDANSSNAACVSRPNTPTNISTPPESPSTSVPIQSPLVIKKSSSESMREKRRSLEDFLKIGLAEDETEKMQREKAEAAAKMADSNDGVVVRPRKRTANAYEGSVDFWEQYDPEEVVLNGQGVVTTEDMVGVEALCFLCGSAGREQVWCLYTLSKNHDNPYLCFSPDDLLQGLLRAFSPLLLAAGRVTTDGCLGKRVGLSTLCILSSVWRPPESAIFHQEMFSVLQSLP